MSFSCPDQRPVSPEDNIIEQDSSRWVTANGWARSLVEGGPSVSPGCSLWACPSSPANRALRGFVPLLWFSQVGERDDWDSTHDHYRPLSADLELGLPNLKTYADLFKISLKCRFPSSPSGTEDSAQVPGGVDATGPRHILSSKSLVFFFFPLPSWAQLGHII